MSVRAASRKRRPSVSAVQDRAPRTPADLHPRVHLVLPELAAGPSPSQADGALSAVHPPSPPGTLAPAGPSHAPKFDHGGGAVAEAGFNPTSPACGGKRDP